MTSKLHISKTLSLPIDFVTSTQAILAQKGKGKTHTAVVEAEELLEAGQQIVVIDPTDAWWGLRSSKDGKEDGFPIAVFGGDHGDVALEPGGGKLLAEAIVREHFSAIISTENLSKNQELTFVADFMETLYRLNRQAMHTFIDEADIFAPQKPFGGEARTCGATDDIVRRGRKKGIGCTLITQRSSVLNKNVLSQADMLVALGCSHPLDLDAIGNWVKRHADPNLAADMMASLPSLPRGEAWIWNPSAEIFKRVEIRDRRTFDSGRTPKAGEKTVTAKVLAKVDIERLGATIAATIERQKQDDPKFLRQRIAQLEKAVQRQPITETTMREISILRDKDIARIEAAIEKGTKLAASLREAADRAEKLFGAAVTRGESISLRIEVELAKLRDIIAKGKQSPGNQPARVGATAVAKTTPYVPGGHPTLAHRDRPERSTSKPVRKQEGDGSLTGPQRVLLTTLAWWNAMGHLAPTKAQLAGKAGWKPRGSNLRNRLSELHAAGLIEYPRSGEVALTATGAAAAPSPNTNDTLIDSIRGALTGPQCVVFEELLANGQRGRDSLAEALSWEPGGSNLRNRLSELSAMELVEYPTKGSVALQPWVTA